MYYIDHYTVKDIPILEVAPINQKSDPLPTVIFIHGIHSAKEHNLHYAYYLAEKGFRVILQDCLYHGERANKQSFQEITFQFWNIVIHSIEELKDIYQYLNGENKLKNNSIGVAGTSMGAIITLGALTKYDWIQTAVSLMGNPAYVEFAAMQIENIRKMGIQLPLSDELINAQIEILKEYDLSQQPDTLNNRPLMFWHGEKDPIVPFESAYSFFEQVKKRYTNQEHFQFYRDPQADHKVSRFGVLKTAEWFEQHLKSKLVPSSH
ncbi:MAG TPA: prolyl oligopeptidase family serine peptidase [Bacillus sp. (in: firmicutes)]|uniref:prolyl oligopeptidase family serine peptidase n=1 Tax=Bacillus litorisediminis TaxID=2922713 RepID=UPI001FAF6EC0|nr:prolyl oligopeptidase family serine peptidase [Bacillus litorisediminis]HWO75053.1 prolyl oligopeptidase family serine peptidase [Bacillus sp. (in: firmicutes)]